MQEKHEREQDGRALASMEMGCREYMHKTVVTRDGDELVVRMRRKRTSKLLAPTLPPLVVWSKAVDVAGMEDRVVQALANYIATQVGQVFAFQKRWPEWDEFCAMIDAHLTTRVGVEQ